MSYINYQPWALLNEINREWDRALQNRQSEQANPSRTWVPAADISES